MEKIKLFFENVWFLFEKYIITRIEGIEVKDIFDIFILSLILFFVFRFIMDRRAGKLALGLLLLAIILFVGNAFDMHAITFILQNFYQAGIIAIIIVFQPELRAALEKMGTASISNIKNISVDIKSTSYISNAISVISETVCDLSMEKTGALIVIERSTKLGDHIKTGTILNAQLTAPLLKNIFFNKAPLHDGAVILRNYRIFSAGCFLPLSTKEDIVSDLGTRHRAAIGISELSDAIVIVVSEETGNISIAKNGTLKRNYSYKTLKNELSKLLLPNVEQHSKSGKDNKKATEFSNEEDSAI